MSSTNVYKGSYDDLSEITVNAENMDLALEKLHRTYEDRDPTILRKIITGIQVPDPPAPIRTVTVSTKSEMRAGSSIDLPSTVTSKPDSLQVAIGTKVAIYAIDTNVNSDVEFVGWFLNDTLISTEVNTEYLIPDTASDSILLIARYAEKPPIPVSSVKIIAKAEMLYPEQTLPNTVSVEPDVVIVSGGSSVYIGTKDSNTDPMVAFIGWYLEDELVSSAPVFEYPVPKTVSGELHFIAKYELVKQLVKTKSVQEQNLELYFSFITYANGLWVACSDDGLYTSTNGTDWSQVLSGYFTFATYANGLWVACGRDGLYTSTNGTDWSQVLSSTRFEFATYANGLWVAGGQYTVGLYTSTNGTDWSQVLSSDYFTFATYANGLWVAGGEGNSAVYATGLYTSTNGTDWSQVLSSAHFAFATYANGLWVACSDDGLYTSTNGTDWSQVLSGYFTFATYANGLWVACRDNGLYASINGTDWSKVLSGYFTFATYANGLWVAGGQYTVGLYTSTNGTDWSQVLSSAHFAFATYANGLWVACSDDGLYTSTNGTDWSQVQTKIPGGGIVRPEQIYAELGKPVSLYAIASDDAFKHWEDENSEVLTTEDTYNYTFSPDDIRSERVFTAVFSSLNG